MQEVRSSLNKSTPGPKHGKKKSSSVCGKHGGQTDLERASNVNADEGRSGGEAGQQGRNRGQCRCHGDKQSVQLVQLAEEMHSSKLIAMLPLSYSLSPSKKRSTCRRNSSISARRYFSFLQFFFLHVALLVRVLQASSPPPPGVTLQLTATEPASGIHAYRLPTITFYRSRPRAPCTLQQSKISRDPVILKSLSKFQVVCPQFHNYFLHFSHASC